MLRSRSAHLTNFKHWLPLISYFFKLVLLLLLLLLHCRQLLVHYLQHFALSDNPINETGLMTKQLWSSLTGHFGIIQNNKITFTFDFNGFSQQNLFAATAQASSNNGNDKWTRNPSERDFLHFIYYFFFILFFFLFNRNTMAP